MEYLGIIVNEPDSEKNDDRIYLFNEEQLKSYSEKKERLKEILAKYFEEK